MESALLLLVIPVAAALLLLPIASLVWRYLVTAAAFISLSLLSVKLFFAGSGGVYAFDHLTQWLVIALDVVLLLFFAYEGIRHREKRVYLLAFLQLLLYGIVEAMLPGHGGHDIVMDELSHWMFLIINIVGGIIVVYAVTYMEYETQSPFKKRLFIVYLLLFLSVMNLIVMADSIMLFFLLFEMTTLASYLLISFRKDETAVHNSLRALWMNQVGGVAILLGALVAVSYNDPLYFSRLVESDSCFIMLPAALLAVAALVKGAAMPFDKWLLGAMVAPTPVSAMLHSATMVKIAPFLILKLSLVLGGTAVGVTVSITGMLIFAVASYLALARDQLKEILGLSTIAMLGLMVSMAAMGNKEGFDIALVLILFHALGKALLFLTAGLLEKEEHAKSIEAMKGLIDRSPRAALFLVAGFMTMALPPFGLFIGKLFAIEAVVAGIHDHPWLIVNLLGIVIGGVLITLLYFKVASALLSRDSDKAVEKRPVPLGFSWGLWTLLLLALVLMVSTASQFFAADMGSFVYFVLPLAAAALLPLLFSRLAMFDRAREYHCGEKADFDAAMVYFDSGETGYRRIYYGFTALFILILIAGVMA